MNPFFMINLLLSCSQQSQQNILKPDETEDLPDTNDTGGETGGETGTTCTPDPCEGFPDPNLLGQDEGMCISFQESHEKLNLISSVSHSKSTIVDYNQDGFLDVFLMNYGEPDQLFQNNGGTFEDVSNATGLNVGGGDVGSVWGDFDDDGDVDVLLTGFDGTLFYINEGTDYFSEGRMLDSERVPYGALAVLDSGILIGANGHTRFYPFSDLNTEMSATVGLDDAGTAAKIIVADYDGDGWDDVYIANITGKDRLFLNNGNGTYESVEDETGTANSGNDSSTDAEWVSFNDALLPSLYVAGFNTSSEGGANPFYINQQDGTFVDQSAKLGVHGAGNSTRSAWGDFLANGNPALALGEYEQENILYLPLLNKKGRVISYQNIAGSTGVEVNDNGQTQDIQWLDIDGDLDEDNKLDQLVVMFDGGLKLDENTSHSIVQCP